METQAQSLKSNIDRNVESVRDKLKARAALGLKKYGVTTERTDLTRLDWLRHAQEEAMDLAVYLERLIRDEEDKEDAATAKLLDPTDNERGLFKSPEDYANRLYREEPERFLP